MQTMYNLPIPISNIRTRIREEFERNRYVNQLRVADVMIFKSHAEYQVRFQCLETLSTTPRNHERLFANHTNSPLQEMMNFWKQTTHVMSYFKDENFRGDKRLPSNFMSGFLEVRYHSFS